MKKSYLLLVGLLLTAIVHATDYFVDAVNGGNTNSGISIEFAKKNIQNTANLTNPSDTVFIANGTYTGTGNILNINRSGNAAASIVYTNYQGSTPNLKASETTYSPIQISGGTSYIVVNGLELEGWRVNLSLVIDTIAAQAQVTCPVIGQASTSNTPLSKYNGNGITVDSRTFAGIASHHITISNCTVHDFGGGGIAFSKADYITLEGNTVYNTSWYSIYGTSGITFKDFFNFDNNTTAYRNIVRNNTCYNSRMYVLWRTVCRITDGNGIIIDIPSVDYTGKTLIVNNVSFNNGGSGIHSLRMNNMDILHNTAYFNSTSPEISDGEIYARNARNINISNNILIARPAEKVNGNYTDTNIVDDHNVYFGGSSVDVIGDHSFIQDPKFVSASIDPLTTNFRLQPSSPAINKGNNNNTAALDKEGNIRPVGAAVEMGAYESATTINAADCNGTIQNKVLSDGNGTGEPGAGSYFGPCDSRPDLSNSKSRRAIIYPQVLLINSGVITNSSLVSLQFKRALQFNSTDTVQDNSLVRIYLRNEVTDNLGSAAFDWNSILPTAASPATLVFGGEADVLTGNAGGWQTVPFQVPFTYTGANLGVYIEYLQKGLNVTGATDILWLYDNSGSQPLYNTTTYPDQQYATKSATTSGAGVISNSLATSNFRRPVITVGYCQPVTFPLSFQQFYACQKSDQVYLNWLVNNKINNAGFEIQRSKDGQYFETIGWVAAKSANNNIASVNTYSFTDKHLNSGINYYRLIQKDTDGKTTYSKIISVTKSAMQLSLVSVYPNPATDKVNVIVNNAEANAIATISLQDMSGRIIKHFTKEIAAGYNNIEINISTLANGTYVLKTVTKDGEVLLVKVVKR